MWALIREPEAAPQDLQNLVSQEITKRKETPPKESKPKAVKTKPKAVTQQQAEPEIVAAPEPEPKPRAGESELDMTIRAAAEKLSVPAKAVRRRKSAEVIQYSVPIDRALMDLTYANMIFKGELERSGAVLHSGTDNNTRQTLIFEQKGQEQKYQLTLYYDSSIYKSKINPKTITIVVDDFGAISPGLLDDFLKLDTQVCFAIFPDQKYSVHTMQRAQIQGRESLIHVPMEPLGYPRIDPGDNAILVQHSEAQIRRTLTQFIKDMPACMGINNHMGSLATTDPDVMQVVMKTLKEHDKAFLDSRTSNVSVAYQTAQKSHIKAFCNDIFLDSPNINQSTMEAKLNRIIQLSKSQNHVIAITHCHSRDKLEYLQAFISRLKKAGFTLIPLSEVGEYEVPEIL
ncbi:MAG: divergent polysaccharide deacetylase family protein [Candidatus Cloacimonetes bacterium]|nr:divergent polysaccharide deacetylase family protein [Candidatus Cloacimonadota bacterium]